MAYVGETAGDNIGVQLRGRMSNHSIHDVPGASAAQQMAGCVCVPFGQDSNLAAAQQPAQLYLLGRAADLRDDWCLQDENRSLGRTESAHLAALG